MNMKEKNVDEIIGVQFIKKIEKFVMIFIKR